MRQDQNKKWLVIIAVLLAVAVTGLWTRDMAAPATASAEDSPVVGAQTGLRPIEGSSAQRVAMVSELAKVNDKLDMIYDALISGQVKVIVVQDEEKVEEVHNEAATQP